MLTPELVEALQRPINEASPCGDDLEYDPAFTALASLAQGKAEQQFGDTVIPAVEPDWRQVAEQADAVLRRSKDLRAAMLLLRAATRLDGMPGFASGLGLLTGLLDTYWDGIHPKLDADDDNDPTMRLNALMPLTGDAMVLRDLYDARVGVARGVGAIRVRDIAIAHNLIGAAGGEPTYSTAQIQGALEEIHTEHPAALQSLLEVRATIAALHELLGVRTGRHDAVDMDGLRSLGNLLHKVAASAVGSPVQAEADVAPATEAETAASGTAASPAVARGEITTRQDALHMLDRVISYLIQAEPGNPAPLLIERAKKLIGVDFFEIMANLAPNAMDTIETVTGKRPSSD
ncbi:MAG: type VI secretion system protein TssA [Variovorax sp.]|nr:type VI secretion system protein TssA [Variovorax sp.]